MAPKRWGSALRALMRDGTFDHGCVTTPHVQERDRRLACRLHPGIGAEAAAGNAE